MQTIGWEKTSRSFVLPFGINIKKFHNKSMIWQRTLSSSAHPLSQAWLFELPSVGWTRSISIRSLILLSVGSGIVLTACWTNSHALSKCLLKRSAISNLCRFCCSSMTLRVSLAWCGRNSLTKWCMWMKSKVRSSIFVALASDSGFRMQMSTKSRKLAVIEWFNFFSSLRWS